MTTRTKIIFAAAIILSAAASRLVKHPFNFTPVVAMSLFAGCYLRHKWAMILPLAAMALSDIALYATKYGWDMFDGQTTLAVYASIALAYLLGITINKHKTWYTIGLSAFFASILFFLLTNFAVYIFYDWYPHTWQGLIQCYAMALPFFRNSLAGDIIYTGLFFGAYEMVFKLSAELVWQSKTDSINK